LLRSEPVAIWNGSTRITLFVNSGELRAAIPAADRVTSQTGKLRVNNPVSAGGNSAALTFTVKQELVTEHRRASKIPSAFEEHPANTFYEARGKLA
jgi:hypothetical protein